MAESQQTYFPSLKRRNAHTQQNDEKLSFLILMKNELFLARVLVILITIGVFILSIAYSIGQILELKLTDYWCDKKDSDTILSHSQKYELNEGDPSGCWKSKTFTVNYDKLWSTSSYSYAPVNEGISYFKFILFLILAFILFLLIIYNTMILIYDGKDFRIRVLGLQAEKTSQTASNTSTTNFLIGFMSKLYLCYTEKCETDSGWWCIMLFTREIFEVLIQSLTLLYYNGYYSPSSNDVPMSYPQKNIILFACIIVTNCVTACILWLFYAFKPYICHGSLFEIILYSFDVLFDILYTLFPLIIVFESNPNMFVSLAALQTDTFITFLSTYMPLLLLTWSSYSFSWYARQAMNSYYGHIFKLNQMKQMEMAQSTSVSLSDGDENKSAWVMKNTSDKKKQYKKVASVSIIGLSFGIYGIILLSVVITHFNAAISYCSIVTDELYKGKDFVLSQTASITLQKHPELLFWDRCYYKVYPFGRDNNGDYQCQCRSFSAEFSYLSKNTAYNYEPGSSIGARVESLLDWSVYELDTYFDLNYVEILEHILQEWYMLEKFRWTGLKQKYVNNDEYNNTEPPLFNFTSNKFIAKQMRVFQFEDTPIGYMDEAISNWKLLTYFRMLQNDELLELPDSFSELQELRYFAFGINTNIQEFPKQICDLKELRSLSLDLTEVESIPHCVAQLEKLQTVSFTACIQLKEFPIGIFNINGLEEISLLQTAITTQTLMEYNNLTQSEFDKLFAELNYETHIPRINESSTFWFQGSRLCKQYVNGLIPSEMVNFVRFIEDLEICVEVCSSETSETILNYVHCPPNSWQNGVCDADCNFAGCYFDGGDCSQLCECKYQRLLDDICEPECNTTNCLYDGGACLTLAYTATECLTTASFSGCNQTWVGDGFCDLNCQHIQQCGYDLNDCDSCEDNLCATVSIVFQLIANDETNDDLVSQTELCKFWDSAVDAGMFIGLDWKNCTEGMLESDMNQDGQLTLYEILVSTHVAFGVTLEKVKQLNCSICVAKGKYWV